MVQAASIVDANPRVESDGLAGCQDADYAKARCGIVCLYGRNMVVHLDTVS